MKYIDVIFTAKPASESTYDILTALTAEIGFDSFSVENEELHAYIQQPLFDEDALQHMLDTLTLDDIILTYQRKELEDKDWNEEWEAQGFQPLIIDTRCAVHGTAHTDIPPVDYDIVINPRLAFGTGAHATTHQMLEYILEAQWSGKSLLDMGCGTSVLAILAAMRGATPVTAIDCDEWSVKNSMENLALNAVSAVSVELGDASLLKGRHFDIILANIHRNILIADMPSYVAALNPGGEVLMSGFYEADLSAICERGESLGLAYVDHKTLDGWVAVRLKDNR